jgi:uncharacterized protein (TIGR03435 family)
MYRFPSRRFPLKLQPGKDSVEVVVVDHIEQVPTDN